jgi:Uma2 family endonuclease
VTIALQRKTWTEAELLAMPKDGFAREVIGGELIMSPAGFDHGAIIMRIAGPLWNFVRSTGLGETFDGQTGCRMKSGDVLSPDVSFATKASMQVQRKKRKAFFQGSPDLVVEVLSPGDRLSVTKEKIEQYFENGAKLAWVIHPKSRTVHVYREGKFPSAILSLKDKFDGEEVLPGFSLPVANIFSE